MTTDFQGALAHRRREPLGQPHQVRISLDRVRGEDNKESRRICELHSVVLFLFYSAVIVSIMTILTMINDAKATAGLLGNRGPCLLMTHYLLREIST